MAKTFKCNRQIIQGQLLELNHQQRCDVRVYIKLMGDGSYTQTLQKSVKPKSPNQLGLIFGLLMATTISQSNDIGFDTSAFVEELIRKDIPNGVALTEDFLKHLLYQVCPLFHDGKRITLSSASTAEANKFIDDIWNILSSHGFSIPEPRKITEK